MNPNPDNVASQDELDLIGKKVNASMDGINWYSGVLVQVIDLFVPYRILINGGYRGFAVIREHVTA